MRLNSAQAWLKLLYEFIKGFIAGFCTVYSLFSISKKLLRSVAFGILNVVAEWSLGNVSSLRKLLEAFIDGYGGDLAPSFAKLQKVTWCIDIIIYLENLFRIKVS